jgi:hypothetical protein
MIFILKVKSLDQPEYLCRHYPEQGYSSKHNDTSQRLSGLATRVEIFITAGATLTSR